MFKESGFQYGMGTMFPVLYFIKKSLHYRICDEHFRVFIWYTYIHLLQAVAT